MSEPVVIVDYNPDWPALYEKEKGGSMMERDGRPQGPNTFQIRRRDVVGGTDGQPPGPHPHVHILPCPYDTRAVRADSLYSRGERGEDVGGGPWWSPVRCTHLPLGNVLTLVVARSGPASLESSPKGNGTS